MRGVNLGREFWGGKAWNPWKTRPKPSRNNFAIKICWEIRRQFSQNSPGQNKEKSPQIRSAEPRAQDLFSAFSQSWLLAKEEDYILW